MFPFRWLQYSIYHLNLFWSKQDPDIPSFTNIYFFFRVSSFLRSLFNLWFQRIYVKSNSIPRDTKFKQQKWSITQHPSPENLVSPFSLVRNFSIVSRKRGSRERKEGRHRGWEEDGREWRIEIYHFIGNRLRHGRVGGPFMKLPLRNIPLWKRLTPNRSLLFSSPPPPTPRSANGTKREGARETSASYYWNYGRSDARKSKFPRFFCHRIPRIVYDLLPAKRRRFRAALKKRGGRGRLKGGH